MSDFFLDPSVNNVFTAGQTVTPEVIATRDPTVTDNQQQSGTFWFNTSAFTLWAQQGFNLGVPQWKLVSSSSGAIVSVLGTTNQITVTTSAGVATISLPASITTPGSLTTTTSLSATTTVTAGTGITATTGNIVASTGNITSTLGSVSAATTVIAGTGITSTTGNITASTGNFVASAVGQGILLNSAQASGVAASPVVVNGRSGRATFTSVSIAAAADLTLTLTNSSITGSTTEVMLSMSGATTGSALSIKSKTASAGSLAIVVTNGTGATTTVADIQIDFLVLNA